MSSILDQYEQESSRVAAPSTEDTLLLQLYIIIFFCRPHDRILSMTVCSRFLVIATCSNVIIRVDMMHPHQQDEIELPKMIEDRIHKIFLDPTGRHLLISMEQSAEVYYLCRNSKKTKTISKLKGNLINAVGWNTQNTNDTLTGPILLGTTKGLIYETELTRGDDSRIFGRTVDRYVSKLFTAGKEKVQPITGIEFDRMPSRPTDCKYYVLVTTPSRLYQFIGTVSTSAEAPIFQQLFQTYLDTPEEFLELPYNFGTSELRIFNNSSKSRGKSFALMAGPGIYYGDINVQGAAGPNSVTVNSKLMPYPFYFLNHFNYPVESNNKVVPLSIVLTEFHVLILFPDRMKAVCLLNEQLIYDDVFPERVGKFIGLCKDPVSGNIWAYTSQHIYSYKVNQEYRDVWRIYLDQGKFDQAKEYCRDNRMQLDEVLTKEADHLFSLKRYKESAVMYANTQSSFEEIALRFINLEDKEPLKAFLTQKLNSLRVQDRTQMTMLVTWLTEIYLNQLGELKEQNDEKDSPYQNLQKEFCQFLNQSIIKECVCNNRQVIYDLIASHGDVEDLMYFARLMKDFERVISHYIQHEYYKVALEVLNEQNQMELFYKFSPVLMQHIPVETVKSWKKQRNKLDPKRLIPSLVQYDSKKHNEQGNQAIQYLKFCVEELDVRDPPIHNYLLSLYARLQAGQLMVYLSSQGQDPDHVCYDLKYALRLCLELNHKEACVHIYSVMGLYEEAVELALTINVDLAKEQASKPDEEDYELRKKLWLKIARHVVEEEKDVKRAMEFLRECDLLKIEDILPFFHDFVIIDDFKDAIISSLEKYNEHIDSLKEEMDRATKSAEEIRREIQSFRNKYSSFAELDEIIGAECIYCGDMMIKLIDKPFIEADEMDQAANGWL
ncbi:vacuolar protein sorting-associated protein 18 homolog [Octopus bimaculoides]|nr:vacuolar protein sorting-associated protein 18 homolog [Octopus bimaculoides]